MSEKTYSVHLDCYGAAGLDGALAGDSAGASIANEVTASDVRYR